MDSDIRLNAKLIDSKTKTVYKSFQTDGLAEKIISITDSLSAMIRNFLVISELQKENIEYKEFSSTSSPEAYRYFILGKNTHDKGPLKLSIDYLNNALRLDSNFSWAMRYIISSYQNSLQYDSAKKWAVRFYDRRNQMSPKEKLWAEYMYAQLLQTPGEAITCAKQIINIDNQSPHAYFSLGWNYFRLENYDKAVTEFEKVLKIYKKWGAKPTRVGHYSLLGRNLFRSWYFGQSRGILSESTLTGTRQSGEDDQPCRLHPGIICKFSVNCAMSATGIISIC